MRDRHHDDHRTHEGIEAFLDGPAVRRVRRVVDDPSHRGPLAGLDDPAAFAEALRQEDARVARYRRPASVAVLEVAVEGADATSIVEAVGETLRRETRDVDRVGWSDGARFHVLLPETSEGAAGVFVDRVRIASRAVAAWVVGDGATVQVVAAARGAIAGRSLAVALEAAAAAVVVDLEPFDAALDGDDEETEASA